MTELERLQRDIDGLLEANRLDWLELATKPLNRAERLKRRRGVATRTVDLHDLLHRKWEIEDRLRSEKGMDA